MEKGKGREKLEVRMLGGFTIHYNGSPISFRKGGRFKSVYLLQILLIHIKTGISKEQLFQYLYDWEVINDRNNSLNSLIYRLKRQLIAAGLPEEEYISLKNGICSWHTNMETWVDSVAMEELMDEAGKKKGKEKEELLKRVCDLYQGEFLPEASGEVWAAVENTKLKSLYVSGVNQLCSMWKDQGEYQQMLELYTKTAGYYPYEEWQVYQIDCLLELRQYEKAYDIYRKTVKSYSDELGVPPSPRLLECWRRMSGKLVNKESNLAKVKEQLRESDGGSGAYFCPYPSFIDTYRFVCRIVERSGQSLFLMLCSLRSVNVSYNEGKDAMDWLLNAIEKTLRRGDVYTKYSGSQSLILLSGTHSEDCQVIFGRIRNRFQELAENLPCQLEYEVVEIDQMMGKSGGGHF